MKNIIHFWSPEYNKQLPDYEQDEEFERHNLHEIVDDILEVGLNVMIDQTSMDRIIIHVDDKWRFRQH